MKRNLEQLRNMTEQLANQNWNEVPNVKCAEALIDTLVEFHGFAPTFARKIAFRINIEIVSFEIENEHWQVIIKNYAQMISKLYDLVEDSETLFVLTNKMTLKYNGG